MSRKQQEAAKLAVVKLGLAKKWQQRAEAVKSRPEQAMLLRRVKKYRLQAADLERQARG